MKSVASDGRLKIDDLRFLGRQELIKVKTKALRRGIWYRVLSRIERGLVDLAITTVRRVRSPVLAWSLMRAVKRLQISMEGKVARQIRAVGYQFAERLARVAVSWGNRFAVSWVTDRSFLRFLAVCHLNMVDRFGG